MQIVKVFTSHPPISFGVSPTTGGAHHFYSFPPALLNLEVIGSNPIPANAEQLS